MDGSHWAQLGMHSKLLAQAERLNVHSTNEKEIGTVWLEKVGRATGAIDKNWTRPLAYDQSRHRQELDDEAQSDDCHKTPSCIITHLVVFSPHLNPI